MVNQSNFTNRATGSYSTKTGSTYKAKTDQKRVNLIQHSGLDFNANFSALPGGTALKLNLT
jgi:hypothetical protein